MTIEFKPGENKKIDVSKKSDTSDEYVNLDWVTISGPGKKVVSDDGALGMGRKPKVSRRAREFLAGWDNQAQAQQAISIMDKIDSLVSGYDDLELPQFHVAQAEDNTIGLTWKIANATMGMSFNLDINDSSWFLLIGEDNRGVTAFGNFSKFDDVDILLNWIVSLLERLRRKEQPE